ncbi:hypothetical protein [Streptomyces sp. NPDC047071]|uniref:hypothetical protein n=1 Tax=Streptomyces sp. NPDC047071 TaxID=3154808 RepID=UPI003453EF57
MARHASSRGRVAMAATLALSAGPLALAVPPAVAAPVSTGTTVAPAPARTTVAPAPTGTVIDAADRFEPRGEALYGAGRTGYVHREESDDGTSDTVWTEYGTGRTRSVALGSVNGPIVARLRPGFRAMDLTDLDSGESVTINAPSGHSLMAGGFTDRTAVSDVIDRATGTIASFHLLRAEADGTTSIRAVTGMPDDATSVQRVRSQDREGAVLVVNAPGGERAYLLDYRTGAATRIFPGLQGEALPTSFALSPDRVLGYWPEGDAAYTVERGTPGAAPLRTSVPGPAGTPTKPRATMALAGDRILVVRDEPQPKERVGQPLQALRIGADGPGARAETLLTYAGARLAPAADGSVLVVGGTGAADWAVHRVSAGGAGGVRLTAVRAIAPVRAGIDGLALGGGRLTVATAGGGGNGMRALRAYDLSGGLPGTGAPKAVARPEHDSALPDRSYDRCGEDSACVALHALGNGRVAYSTGNAVRVPTSPDTHRTVAPGQGRVRLLDASGRYVLTHSPKGYAVGDSESRTATRVVHTLKARSAALWGTKVWQPGKKAGTVVPYDLKSGKTGAAVTLAARCAPNDLQVVGRWLSWSCGGKVGVRDLKAKRDIALPPYGGLLGDGFLVRHRGTRLELVDFHKGARAPVTVKGLATVPEDARAGVTWTVDRFGGHVAYVDAAQRVRIAPVAVARSPIESIESRTDGRVSAAGRGGTWQGHWQLSRPATAWKVTFKDASGRTSGNVRGTAHDAASVAARWHARTPDGGRPRNGRHTWTLAVKGSGDPAYRTVKTGTLQLTGGR